MKRHSKPAAVLSPFRTFCLVAAFGAMCVAFSAGSVAGGPVDNQPAACTADFGQSDVPGIDGLSVAPWWPGPVFGPEGPGGGTLCAPNLDDTEVYGSSDSDAPRDGGPGCGTAAADGAGGTTDAPLHFTGVVAERPVDFHLPSRGLSVEIRRIYNQRVDADGSGVDSDVATELGFNWTMSYRERLIDLTGGAYLYLADLARSYTYSISTPDVFVDEDDMRILSRLRLDGESGNTFTMQKPDGTRWIFHDFTHGTTALRGRLWKIEGLYASNVITITYNTDGTIDYITDPSGHYFRFGYVTSGTLTGKLKEIDVWEDSTTNDSTKKIARLEYTQKDGNTTSHADCGSDGDLILVKVMVRDSNDTSTLGMSRQTHYRYFKGAYSTNSYNGQSGQIRHIYRPQDMQRAEQDVGVGNVLTASNATIASYLSNSFEYKDTDNGRVKTETVYSAAGTSCCGGGAGAVPGTYVYTYSTNTPSGRNDWALQMKETRPDGSVRYIETNAYGEVTLLAHFEDDGDSNAWNQVWGFQRDTTSGRVTHVYSPTAIKFDPSPRALTYDADGLVYYYAYENESKEYRYKYSKRCKYSETDNPGSGEPSTTDGEMIESIDWDATTGWSYRSTVWPTARYTYPEATGDPAAASKVATHSYAYRRYLDGANVTDRIKVLKTTFTSVPTTENGSGVSTVTYLYFDEDGEVRWSKNGEGRVAYYASDIRNGRTAIMVADVYTGTTEGSIAPSEITAPASNVKDWTGAAPIETTGSPTYDFQTTGSSADYVQLTTKWSFDTRGRIRSVTTPDNQVSYLAYLNNEYRVYPSWDSTNGEPRLPMQRVITDYTTTNRRVSVETVNGKNVSDFASTPNGVETWPSYTDWVAWNRTIFNADGRPAEVWVYKAIPSGLGTENTDYFKTSFAYETLDDSPSGEGKGSVVEVRDAEGGWSKTVLNVAGEPIATYQTATEAGTPPAATNYRLTSEMFYGQATPGTGVSLGGDLTASRSYFGTGSSDYNQDEFLYDWRRDLKVIRHEDSSASEAPPHTVIDYDAMGREIATATYTSASGLSASSTTSTTTNRASLSETSYDKLGRVYSTKTYSLNTNGTTDGNVLLTRVFYDRNHQVVAVDPPNGGVVISKPDGAGRMVESWVCSEMEHTAAEVYTGTGAFDYTSGDIKIIEKTALTLNKASAATIIAHHELNHDDTNGMASGTSDSVATYTLNFFDAAGRLSDTAFYGTNTTAWAGASAPSYGSVPSRSDSILVTSYGYDAASSRITSVTDPKAIVSEYAYNALGQVTLVTESKGVGGSDLNRKTAYDYDYIGNVKKIYAKEVANYDASGGNDDQITEYVREDTTDTSWVTQIRYPMPSTGAPAGSTDYNDMVRLEYNIDGTIESRTDQIGNVIEFEYDDLRRLTDQRVTTLAGDTDGDTRRISYTYENTGRLQRVTSHTATTGGSVDNEVQLSYNGYGALTKDAQSHAGAVDGSTPAVEYAYAHSDSTDQGTYQNYFSRLKNIKYPNGRYVWYDYGHSTGGIATMNNYLSRVSRIADGDSSAASKVLAEYSFNGLGRMVQRDHIDLGSGSIGKPGNKTALRFIRQGSTGDMYPDFDRFGRVTAVRHLNYNGYTADSTSASAVAHFGYRYDRNSNRTYAETLHNIGRSRYFTYDNLNRLTSDKIGQLNSGKTDLTDEWAKPGEDTWTLDILGNWTAQDKRSTDTAASESRAHNATNEISSRTVAAEAARFWISEDFADNDTVNWSIVNLNSGSSGEAWSASSGVLACTGVETVSGAPGGSGSIIFVDAGTYQDFQIGVSATVPSSGSHIGGLVFGYRDASNYWLLIIDRPTGKTELYEVSAGTFTLRQSRNIVFGSGDTMDIFCEVRHGAVESMFNSMTDYLSGTIPAGKVGLWAGTAGGVQFDNFKVLSLAENAEVDGRWYSTVGGVSVNTGTGKLDFATSSAVSTAGISAEKLAIRRGFRGGKYVLEADCPTATNDATGIVLHYQDPENYMLVNLAKGASVTPSLLKRENGVYSTQTTGTAFTMTSGDTVRCVIADDPGNSALQELKVYVAGTLRLTSTKIDDEWSSGEAGLLVRAHASGTLSFDNFKIGYDDNADGDIADADDDIQIDDDFSSDVLSLVHDHAGNLTDDGVLLYTYDAWNRLVAARRRVDAQTPVAAYEYDGLNRRIRKHVDNSGVGVVPGSDAGGIDGIQAGNLNEHYYYAGWRVIEERDNSANTLAQTVYGTEYIDAPVCRDRNTDVTAGGSPDDDCLDSGGSARYFYHQDANFRVVAMTDESAAVVERYDYDAYGEPRVYAGVSGSAESGALRMASAIGNPYLHQGLRWDGETGLHENRYRMLHSRLGRFMQRDPEGYIDGLSLYALLGSSPIGFLDPLGLGMLKKPVQNPGEDYCDFLERAIEEALKWIWEETSKWVGQIKNTVPIKNPQKWPPYKEINPEHAKKIRIILKWISDWLDTFENACAHRPDAYRRLRDRVRKFEDWWSTLPKERVVVVPRPVPVWVRVFQNVPSDARLKAFHDRALLGCGLAAVIAATGGAGAAIFGSGEVGVAVGVGVGVGSM